jgi:SAM-dependent methyltransferase
MSMDHAGYSGLDNLELMQEAANYNRHLASLIEAQLRPCDRVLDFGAGLGTFAVPLRESGVDVVCVETDAQLAARLRRLAMPTVATLAELPDESIDLAYTLNVLEHIADDGAAVAGLARKLKPGGRLFVYVPAFPVLFSAMDRKVGHFRRYRRAPLVGLVAGAGLSVRRAVHVDSLGFAASLLYRLVGSDTGEIDAAALRTYDRLVFPVSRALDALVGRWVGKNLLVIAAKSAESG